MSSSSKAGKASGRKRASQAKLRRLSVLTAFARLQPIHQAHPYSDRALDALEEELRKDHKRVFTRDEELGIERPVRSAADLDRPPPPKKVLHPEFQEKLDVLLIECIDDLMQDAAQRDQKNRKRRREAQSDTLLKDLKALGIRSKRPKIASG